MIKNGCEDSLYVEDLSYGQKGILFEELNNPDNHSYILGYALKFEIEINENIFIEALRYLIERHPVLNSKIEFDVNKNKQSILNKSPYTRVINFVESEGEIYQKILDLYNEPLRIDDRDLFKAFLIRTEGNGDYCFFQISSLFIFDAQFHLDFYR